MAERDALLLPDILAPNLQVIFCGINPALSAAEAGYHFLSPSNRFWRVLHRSGFTPHQIRPTEDRSILNYGVGITAAVDRATRGAAELQRVEFLRAAAKLQRKVRRLAPSAIAFLGKAAYAAMTKTPQVEWGHQDPRFGDADTWVLPNPSGLNRCFDLDALVVAYREMRMALHVKPA